MAGRLQQAALRILALPVLLLASGALAGDIEYLRKNERFCDISETLCLHGSISYRVNERVVELNARVERAPGPGTLRIGLSGENRQGHRRATEIAAILDGRHSEIVSVRMIPDAPDVYSWRIDSIIFTPD